MCLLLPLRKIHPDTYYWIEGKLFHWLLANIAMWGYTAGYDCESIIVKIEHHRIRLSIVVILRLISKKFCDSYCVIICFHTVVELGDDITPCLDQRTLVIVNHQSTADVPLLMTSFNTKHTVLPNIMWIMDKVFMYTNFGVVSLIHRDFFIGSVSCM